MQAMKYISFLALGIYFGIVLVKAGVASPTEIKAMFLFESPRLFLIIGSAVVTGAMSLVALRRLAPVSIVGEPIVVAEKKFNKGYVYGGVIFGMGWAITGACPGPIFAQIGAGEFLAISTFVGAFLGTAVYSYLRPKLPH